MLLLLLVVLVLVIFSTPCNARSEEVRLLWVVDRGEVLVAMSLPF